MTCILKRQGITLVPYKCKKCGKEIFHIGYCDDCKHMTCTDCIYYNGTVQATHTDYHICMKPKYKGFESWEWVSSKLEKCKDFEPKDDSWESVSK